MANLKGTKANITIKSDVAKTGYWLNVRTPFGVIGTSLADGITTHAKLLKGIRDKGTEYVNEYFEKKGLDMYVTQEGTSNDTMPDDF